MRIISGDTLVTATCLACSILCTASLFADPATPPDLQIQQILKDDVYAILKSPLKVTAYKIKPQLKVPIASEPTPVGPIVHLNRQQIERLQRLLLNDTCYHFDLSKSCVFFGELVLKFQAAKNVLIVFSPSCAQLQFVANGRTQLLDYDPVMKELSELFQELKVHGNK